MAMSLFLVSFEKAMKPLVDLAPDLAQVAPIGVLTQVFAKAGLFEASERRRHVRLVVGVDENCAGVQLFTDIKSFTDVPREDPRSQAELRVIGPPQHLVHLAEAEQQWWVGVMLTAGRRRSK